ncbi:MAG TPA: hypothetical protein VGB82_04145 [Alphaproteobacteria bacterium]
MSATDPRPGFLAIWSDVDAPAETDYLHWMTREHALERLGIPGFIAMRMFRALDVEMRRYFILYELEHAGVVASDAYLARLNHPTAWTQRTMARVSNFIRGGGHIEAVVGTGHGGFLTAQTLKRAAMADPSGLAAVAANSDRIAAARVLATDHGRTSIQTREKDLRAGDSSFDGLLVIEGLDAPAVRAAFSDVVRHAPSLAIGGDGSPTVYETIFSRPRR